MSTLVKLTIGSHLHGVASDESDLDLLHLWVPTVAQLVSNKRVVHPHLVTDEVDERFLPIGEFVVSLGTNVENTLVALSYPEYFGELEPFFLHSSLAYEAVEAAHSMAKGKTPKQKAHAWRVLDAARKLTQGVVPRYPMEPWDQATFRAIKSGEEKFDPTWGDEIRKVVFSDSPWSREAPDIEYLASWAYGIIESTKEDLNVGAFAAGRVEAARMPYAVTVAPGQITEEKGADR